MELNDKVEAINRVGANTARVLKKLEIITIKDLLFYFPFRYDDFSATKKIKDLQSGERANITVQIQLIQSRRSFKKRMMMIEALVADETGEMKVVWFNQPFIANVLKTGDQVSLSGRVSDDLTGLSMVSPTYERLTGYQTIHTQGLVPNYHLTTEITNKQLRFLISQVLPLTEKIVDWLPAETKKQFKLIGLSDALTKIHFPKNQTDIDEAKRRLAFNELFLLQLQFQQARQNLVNAKAPIIEFNEQATKDLVSQLPFTLTDDQRRAVWEILLDLKKDQPMTRLLEGDVGSGKTIVALLAMFNVALNNKQAVLMAPTEILAKQHFATFSKLLATWNLPIAIMTRTKKSLALGDKVDDLSKKKMIEVLSDGQAKIIIGTHALIQEGVKFNNLALTIIDEQHRFGVEQRQNLVDKLNSEIVGAPLVGALVNDAENRAPTRGAPTPGMFTPHLLSMTATPIPRSLALALYGDLSISIIKQLPAKRLKIITDIVSEERRAKAYEFIKSEIKTGRQAFVICPLIDWSDKLGYKSVKDEYEKLSRDVFPELKLAMLHGKLKSEDKERIMQEFVDNQINILVATAVVEVGIDVPNATVMMIEDADRFGLAQLHQYRGRVGRGQWQSYCLLMAGTVGEIAQKRLASMLQYDSGFDLAKVDLKSRGPGEVYGVLQKGFPQLKIADLFDYELMKQAKEGALELLDRSPDLTSWPLLKQEVTILDKQIHLE